MTTPPQKPRPTAADVLAAAISPALIMLLVGSLVFFMLELVYGGPYAARLRWTMFWFVLAMVLVSRISVEEGFGKASIYGVALAWATAMWIFRFVDFVFGVLAFLAFIWWCAGKLVWDVTVIPDDEDTSGEGLMSVAGFAIPGEGEMKGQFALLPWWKRLFKNESERSGRPHSPGLWVVYFSMAALPFFGLGYALIPAANSAQRASCFHYLWLFAISAMGLLLVSSFLGLRRYLRQRYLTMPVALTRKWFQSGLAMILMILIGSLLLPRPEGTYQVSGVLRVIGSPEQPASKQAKMESDPAKGSGKEIGEGGAEEARAGANGANNPSQSSGTSKANKKGQGNGAPKSTKDTSLQTTGTAGLLRTVTFAVLVLVAIFLLIRYWRVILDFLRSIFGDFKTSVKVSAKLKIASTTPAPPKRKFSSFSNPFATGEVARLAPGELITHTFAALEAWAREHGAARDGFATPMEFGAALSDHFFTMETDLKETTRAYSQFVYGNVVPHSETIEALERLWTSMSTSISREPRP